MTFGVNLLPKTNNVSLGSEQNPWTIVSPTLTGTPIAPTALPGTNNNQIATTAFVMNAMQGSIVITINPAHEGIIATARLNNSNYSNSAISNELGQITIPLEQYGDYILSYNDIRVKSDTHIKVISNVAVQVAARYSELIVYTLRIDETNSNPNTACVYQDDAVGMVKGSSDWDNLPIFNDIAPCVFKDGEIAYYLNPNDFAKKKDGTNATLTGADGDVMIEFKKFAYRIYREDKYLYVSVTNNDAVALADNRYTYDAFSRINEGDLDKFFVGAFKGYLDTTTGKLRSIIGVQPTANKNIGEFRAAAQANGDHYQQSMYSHLKAMQCLYLIKYGTRNGQEALGRGVANNNSSETENKSYLTGSNVQYINGIAASPAVGDGTSTLAVGMCHGGSTTDGKAHVKLFGIEDFWGNIWEWVDGLTTDADRNIITSWNSFTGEDDVIISTNSLSSGLTEDSTDYIRQVAGTTAAGFMPIAFGNGNVYGQTVTASTSTAWSDRGALFASCYGRFGGNWHDNMALGPFYLRTTTTISNKANDIGARLSYN